ncbi:hypothetical protein BU23DRAFT_373084, partial [Bimuria novae-zelandiae CBS 107.79]
AAQVIAVISAMSILGTLFVGLRLWIRLVVAYAPGYDDLFIVLSWVCLQVHFGLGHHADALGSARLNEGIMQNHYVSIILYNASLGLTKLAILIQYKRVFAVARFQRWNKRFIIIITVYSLAIVTTSIFPCRPFRKFWVLEEYVDGFCINFKVAWAFNASLNILSDLMITVLPMPVINSLNLPARQKRLLMGVFALGFVYRETERQTRLTDNHSVCAVSVARIPPLIKLAVGKDPPWDNALVAIFSSVEVYIALICASLPPLKTVVAKYFP